MRTHVAWFGLSLVAGCAELAEDPSESSVAVAVGGCQGSVGWPCDDGNSCTLDQCVANQCVHSPPSSTCLPSNNWFVAPAPVGSPTGSGTKTSPWSLDYAGACAGARIVPGDTVNLASGTYWGRYTIRCSGTAERRITYIAATRHGALVEAAIQGFTDHTEQWEQYWASPGKNIYRSQPRPLDNLPNNKHYVGFIRHPNGPLTLIAHGHNSETSGPALNYLSSDIHEHAPDGVPRYVGPGLAYDVTSRRIYVRLDNSTPAAQRNRPVWPMPSTDPNDLDLRIAPYDAIALKVIASHVLIDGLAIATAGQGINTNNGAAGATNITFRNLDVTPGYVGARLGPATNVHIESSKFHAHMPALHFSAAEGDFKGGDFPPAHNTRKLGIDLNTSSSVSLIGNELDEFHDGILSEVTSTGAAAHHITLRNNTFRQTWDDSWQLQYPIHHVDIGYNKFLGAGISRDGTHNHRSVMPNQGTVWIHHNIFAPHERQVWWYRGGGGTPPPTDVEGDGMIDGIPLSSHRAPATDEKYGFPYRLYYNTFIVHEPKDGAVSIGLIGHFGNVAANAAGDPVPTKHECAPHEVYNNIFIDKHGIRPGPTYWLAAHRAGTADPCGLVSGTLSGREMYDGNVYSGWTTAPIYRYVRLSTGTQIPNVMKPENLVSHPQIGPETRSYPIPSFATSQQGWESRGFSMPLMTIPSGCYAPTPTQCPGCTTGAVSLVGSGWPGTEVYESWRGATPPAACP